MTSIPTPSVTQEAAAWHTRLSRRSVTTRELKAFRDWRRDPAHAAAYAEVDAAWSAAGELALDPDLQAATARALAQPPPRPTVAWFAIPKAGPLAGLAVVAVAVGLGYFTYEARTAPSWSTRTGEQRLVVLQDGSRIRLNTDSKVQVRYRSDRRDITLLRGEAFFEASHNPDRPFTVTAGPAAVRAVGTRFDVRRDGVAVRVTLVEGKVDVRQATGPSTTLLPNQQLTVTAKAITPPRPADAPGATSWTAGRLIFRNTPLREAVAEVNRYATKKIVLDGPDALTERPVSGAFNTGDTGSFVSAVDTLFNLQPRIDPDGDTHLGSRAAAPGG
jgi:transmembrane sensor